MNNRLQELTDKIYQEGISKGQEDANLIKSKAQADAAQILATARKEAEQILAIASKKATEIKENTNSEIKLASRQAIDALKLEVVNLINGSITSAEIKEGMRDIHFIQSAIELMIKNWAINNETDLNMKVLIPEKDEKTIVEHFNSKAKGLLNKGFSIETVNGIKSGFQVTPEQGGYKISFTDQDFIAFFQEYLRPKVVEFLFDKK
jgi:V/A-type H+-transporting ATPase subunit E